MAIVESRLIPGPLYAYLALLHPRLQTDVFATAHFGFKSRLVVRSAGVVLAARLGNSGFDVTRLRTHDPLKRRVRLTHFTKWPRESLSGAHRARTRRGHGVTGPGAV